MEKNKQRTVVKTKKSEGIYEFKKKANKMKKTGRLATKKHHKTQREHLEKLYKLNYKNE